LQRLVFFKFSLCLWVGLLCCFCEGRKGYVLVEAAVAVVGMLYGSLQKGRRFQSSNGSGVFFPARLTWFGDLLKPPWIGLISYASAISQAIIVHGSTLGGSVSFGTVIHILIGSGRFRFSSHTLNTNPRNQNAIQHNAQVQAQSECHSHLCFDS
jgi:hypothetical protein